MFAWSDAGVLMSLFCRLFGHAWVKTNAKLVKPINGSTNATYHVEECAHCGIYRDMQLIHADWGK